MNIVLIIFINSSITYLYYHNMVVLVMKISFFWRAFFL